MLKVCCYCSEHCILLLSWHLLKMWADIHTRHLAVACYGMVCFFVVSVDSVWHWDITTASSSHISCYICCILEFSKRHWCPHMSSHLVYSKPPPGRNRGELHRSRICSLVGDDSGFLWPKMVFRVWILQMREKERDRDRDRERDRVSRAKCNSVQLHEKKWTL